MKALKALVIGMGLLIVAGLGGLGWGLYRNTHRAAPVAAPVAALPSVPVPAEPLASATAEHGFFTVDVPVPEGARLEQVGEAGGRLVLRLSGGEGDRLVLIDPASGRVTGTVTLVPRPPAIPSR